MMLHAHRPVFSRFGIVAMLAAALLVGGCQKKPWAPDYARPLPPGAFGLRKITDPARMPDLTPVAQQVADPGFQEAAKRSLTWFGYESTQEYYPIGPISHVHARTSVFAMIELGRMEQSEALNILQNEFDVWESVGWDGSGQVLYTGYFSPVFNASLTRTGPYQHPLYTRPPDLVSDSFTGEVIGRDTANGIVAYPARQQIEADPAALGLVGRELVYLPSRLDAYIIQVNGSARLNLPDGRVMHVGYAGTNGHDYTSIGQLLIEEGKLDRNTLSLSAIRSYFRANPIELDRYISKNDRYVFFQQYDGDKWPAGSLGFKVTPMRTLATDKTIFPRGSVVFATTSFPSSTGPGMRQFDQLMLDQDTGGAIRAAGRADIYVGIGDRAEQVAGRQAAEGQLYYLLLKPERVQVWYDRMRSTGPVN